MRRQRQLAKALSRKQKGSHNREDAAARLRRHHRHVASVRRHFLHQVSNALVKTHGQLVIEDLNVMGMLANHRIARSISDAGWAEFARLLHYKQDWRGGKVLVADRWYPSSRLCPACGALRGRLRLADRVFTCGCGHVADRDYNAAVNLARWGKDHQYSQQSPDPQAGGRLTNARGRDSAGRHPTCVGETGPDEAGTDVHTTPAC
jgi:putative transposase